MAKLYFPTGATFEKVFKQPREAYPDALELSFRSRQSGLHEGGAALASFILYRAVDEGKTPRDLRGFTLSGSFHAGRELPLTAFFLNVHRGAILRWGEVTVMYSTVGEGHSGDVQFDGMPLKMRPAGEPSIGLVPPNFTERRGKLPVDTVTNPAVGADVIFGDAEHLLTRMAANNKLQSVMRLE